ncbi:hypothetical protein BRADI_1g44387v3 [Brachypodium distachyon]|uniref:Uncharacterized protein n=1 Tax=Brachypodium distachyon TaxID=15368 RepID=A0A2K2DPC1_BRADI|nr:hypothetical protein BRADI_1g44387v3 [Brachypodium distachyon]
MTMRSKFIVPVIVMAITALLVTSMSARPLLDGETWAGESSTAAVAGESILKLPAGLYLQKLGARPSCTTNSPSVGCPPPPPNG